MPHCNDAANQFPERMTVCSVRKQMSCKVDLLHMSLCMRKPTSCMGENKDADQLRGYQGLCFRYTDSTFPPLLIPKLSRFWVSSVTVQAGLCWTWSETQIVGFLMHGLIFGKKFPDEPKLPYICWAVCQYPLHILKPVRYICLS